MADGDGGLFARTGKDSINIAGHKVPIALVGGVAALLTVVLVLRARSKGRDVAALGQPYTAASNGFGLQGFSPDYSGALANLSQQLSGLQGGGLNGASPPSPSSKDFDLTFGLGGTGKPTHISEAGNVVSAFDVSQSLGVEWGSIVAGGEQPTEVYRFIQDLFSSYGIGTPAPQSGFFIAHGPGGAIQRIPYWAPGHAPINS